MANPKDPTRQHLVHRSFLFARLPIIILAALTLNLVWEIVRANLNTPTRSTWPFRFVLLDLSTTAALCGGLAGLFLARLQWAKANQPSLSYHIVDEGANFSASSDKWSVWIQNGGPGIAIVERYSYAIKLTGRPKSAPISLNEINLVMRSKELVDGKDYFIREQGPGAVYPAVPTYAEGPMICWLTSKAIAELEELEILLRYTNVLGDVYQRTLVILGRMPSVAFRENDRGPN